MSAAQPGSRVRSLPAAMPGPTSQVGSSAMPRPPRAASRKASEPLLANRPPTATSAASCPARRHHSAVGCGAASGRVAPRVGGRHHGLRPLQQVGRAQSTRRRWATRGATRRIRDGALSPRSGAPLRGRPRLRFARQAGPTRATYRRRGCFSASFGQRRHDRHDGSGTRRGGRMNGGLIVAVGVLGLRRGSAPGLVVAVCGSCRRRCNRTGGSGGGRRDGRGGGLRRDWGRGGSRSCRKGRGRQRHLHQALRCGALHCYRQRRTLLELRQGAEDPVQSMPLLRAYGLVRYVEPGGLDRTGPDPPPVADAHGDREQSEGRTSSGSATRS